LHIFVVHKINMMRKKALIIAIITLLSASGFCQQKEKIKGDRNVTPRETKVNSFNSIIVGENFKVDIIEGNEALVFIEADDNLHDIISFNVVDSTLKFQTLKKITSSKKINIKVVYTKTLKHIETLDNGEISSLTTVNLDELILKNSGTSRAYLNIKTKNIKVINGDRARVKLNLTTNLATLELIENSKLDAIMNTDSLKIDMYQSADAKIEGTLNKLNIRTDNSSKFIGKELATNNCELLSEGNSNISVHVIENLYIQALGSSEISIYNNPKIVINKFVDTAKLYKKEMKP
jgi:Putative auto-transporter adhesin, head GIN domain